MRTGEEEEDPDESGTTSFESLLDVCLALGLTRKPLRWHYRSRREALIAFSNRYIYDGRLVTFPSRRRGHRGRGDLLKVPDGRYKEGVNPVEAGLPNSSSNTRAARSGAWGSLHSAVPPAGSDPG